MRAAHVMEATPRGALLWVCAATAAAALLHAIRMPVWITLATLALIGWRLAALSGALRLPGGLVRIALGLTLVAGVFAQFHTLNGLVPGTAMLLLMMTVKLLETRRRRDQYVMIGGTLFLLLAACLDRQDLAWVPLYGAEALLCCSALAVVAHAPGPDEAPPAGKDGLSLAAPAQWPAAALSPGAAVSLAGRTLLYSLPLAILMFLFFPRLPGHFWALPAGGDAVTGLGDTLAPGSITSLTFSYGIAFRARFDGRPPPPEERYWRGPVMHDFDGATWKAGRYAPAAAQRLDCLSRPSRYRIYLEPTFRRWWLALDTVLASPVPDVEYTGDYQLIAARVVSQSLSYSAISCTSPRSPGPLSPAVRAEDTQLPPGRNPGTRALAVRMRRAAGSDAAFVQSALSFLRKGGFSYSLAPPPLAAEPVDDFLFRTRTGFCGHYASAFVALMRAGGVPARVVTGYLGGQWNPYDGTLIVRQSDAHAWAEVWLEGRGWTRIDPTAVVAPERLRHGILDLLPDAVSAPARLVHAWPWLGTILERWDALNGWWNERVVGYDYRTQLDLLRSLGLRSPALRDAGWIFAATLLAWLAWVSWQLGKEPRPPSPDRLGRAYARLCRKLARAGLARAPHQGPLAYAEVITQRRPDLTARVRPLLEQYARLRYGPPAAASHLRSPSDSATGLALRAFERAVARLSLTPRARGSRGR